MPQFNYHQWQWLIFVSILSAVFLHKLAKKIGGTLTACTAYFLTWTIYRCYFEDIAQRLNPLAALVVEVYGNNFFTEFLLFGIALIFLNPKIKNIEKTFSWLCILNTSLCFLRLICIYLAPEDLFLFAMDTPILKPFFVNDIWWRGLVANPSMNGIFTALLIPFLEYKWFIPLAVIAVLTSKSATCVGIIAFYAIYLLWKKYRFGIKSVLAAITITAGSVAGFLHYRGMYSITSSGRLLVWEKSMRYFHDFANIFYGVGPSTYFVYGPLIQKFYGFQTPDHDIWVMLHSDILQTLFQFGYTGLIVLIVSIASILNRALWHEKTFVSLSAFLIAMTNYYPLEWPSHLSILLFLLLIAFSPESAQSKSDAKPNSY